MGVLDDPGIRDSLRQAWEDSQPNTGNVHEEGGFILRAADGSLQVERWPRGVQNRIIVPDRLGGKRGGLIIVATFHTHPNRDPSYQQEPSLTDIRAVRDDPDLAHPEYEGEYVIAFTMVYQIRRDGTVVELGDPHLLLGIP
jgi:hypothetical protein